MKGELTEADVKEGVDDLIERVNDIYNEFMESEELPYPKPMRAIMIGRAMNYFYWRSFHELSCTIAEAEQVVENELESVEK